MTKRTYRNTPKPTRRGSRARPALFASPKHFEKHGKPLSEDKLRKAAARYGIRDGQSNLRRGERKAA